MPLRYHPSHRDAQKTEIFDLQQRIIGQPAEHGAYGYTSFLVQRRSSATTKCGHRSNQVALLGMPAARELDVCQEVSLVFRRPLQRGRLLPSAVQVLRLLLTVTGQARWTRTAVSMAQNKLAQAAVPIKERRPPLPLPAHRRAHIERWSTLPGGQIGSATMCRQQEEYQKQSGAQGVGGANVHALICAPRTLRATDFKPAARSRSAAQIKLAALLAGVNLQFGVDGMAEEQSETQESVSPEDLARLFTVPLEPARALVKTLLDLFLHIEVSGMENIPLEGGAILVCNHTDYVDVPVQAVHSPRKIVYLGKAELFEPEKDIGRFLLGDKSPLNIPGLSMFKPLVEAALSVYGQAHRAQLKEWGGHPIIRNFRGDGARAAVEYYQELEEFMVQLLKDGMLLSIFPEGTRTETGVMGPFKAMTAKLAIRAGVPIIPSGISGSWKMTSLDSVLSGRLFSQTIRYNIGQPILPQDFPEGDEKRAAKELTSILEQQVYALTQHPERRGHPRTRARVL